MTRGERAVAVREREARALRLYAAGLTLKEVGEALGISESMAHRIVHRALDRIPREPGEAQIALEAVRLDQLHRAVWTKALGGNLAAVDRALAISKRRADLLGLDKHAPPEAVIAVQVNLVLDLVAKALAAALPNDAVAYQFGMDAAVAELRRIATDEAGDVPELEAGP